MPWKIHAWEGSALGGRNITNLRAIADDIDALAEEEQELEGSTVRKSMTITCTRYKMEISAEKTKLMNFKQCQWHPERDT